jgi:hypothetical protein
LAKGKRIGGVLGCFDKDLSVRRDLFADAVTICDLETPDPVEVHPEVRGTPRVGTTTVRVSGILDWLGGFAEGGHTFYAHHHDNIVADVALYEPYERAAFLRRLPWFRTRPADEGGSNLLGVEGPDRSWLLVLENDNQGRFWGGFFGPASACDSLRACLKQCDPPGQPDR